MTLQSVYLKENLYIYSFMYIYMFFFSPRWITGNARQNKTLSIHNTCVFHVIKRLWNCLFSFQLKYFMFCNNFSPHIIDVMLCWNNECGYFYKYPDGYYDIHDTLNIFKFVPLEVFLIKYVYKKLNRGNKNPSICIFVSYATLLI